MTAKLKPIEVDDITKYIIPSNLKYSPDGRYLAFQTSSADVEKNSYHTDVYVEKDLRGIKSAVINKEDLNFEDRSCIVQGKGNKQKRKYSKIFRSRVYRDKTLSV